MAQVYFETDDLKKLSNYDLIVRQQQLVDKLSYASKGSMSSEVVKQLRTFLDAYNEEVDRRYSEGLIDEDELDNLFNEDDEDEEPLYSHNWWWW